jgi:opacity protein-like surface antigen
MKKIFALFAALLVMTAFSSITYAGNPYASGSIGTTWFSNTETRDIDDVDNWGYTLDFDSSVSFTGAVGYDFGSTRLEAEVGRQTNSLNAMTLRSGNYAGWADFGETSISLNTEYAGVDPEGDVSITSFMLNGYYDLPITSSGVEVFLTGGLGGALIDFDNYGAQFPYWEGIKYTSSFTTSTWAYQLGAGVAVPVSSKVMIDARYRYFSTFDFSTEASLDAFFDQAMNMSLSSHSAMLGLRVGF